jgi:hypothetical protein
MLNRIVLCFSLVSAPAFSYLDQDHFDSCVRSYYSTPKEGLGLQHESSFVEVEQGRRIHHFSILSTQPDSEHLMTIGRVKLVDFQEHDPILGHFALDLIEIAEEYQGKGFGSKALKEVVSFSQILAAKDQEYTYLQLQCADETASGEQLGKVPYRLSYYLNAGFQLDTKTFGYMQHLDRNYFIQRLSLKQFKDFIGYYLPPETAAVARKYSSTILRELKKIAKGSGLITEDQVLQIAESSSSDAAQRILDRLFYDSRIRDTEQMCSGGYMYLMHMNVFEWEKAKAERQALLSSRGKTKALDPSEDDDLKYLIEALAENCASAQQSRAKRRIGKENLTLEENEALKPDLKRAKN